MPLPPCDPAQHLLGASGAVLAKAADAYAEASGLRLAPTAAYQGADAQGAALQMAGAAEALELICRELQQCTKDYNDEGAPPPPSCRRPLTCLQARLHWIAHALRWAPRGRPQRFCQPSTHSPRFSTPCAVAACYAACGAAHSLAARICPSESACESASLMRGGGSKVLEERESALHTSQIEALRGAQRAGPAGSSMPG